MTLEMQRLVAQAVHEVLGLDISVNHSFGVQIPQNRRELD